MHGSVHTRLDRTNQMMVQWQKQQNKEISQIKSLVADLVKELRSIKEKVEQHSKALQRCDGEQHMADGFVAFTASNTERAVINAGDIIVFDRITTNYGNHYNSDTGIFTCPYDAYYIFFTSLISDPGERMAGSLVVNGEVLVRVHSKDETLLDQASNLVVTYCGFGQQVWVEGVIDGDVIDDWGLGSTFSGVLLRVL